MPVKKKTVFVCSECGYTSAKWMGKCPSCGEWNTMAEEVIHPETQTKGVLSRPEGRGRTPMRLSEVSGSDEARTHTGIAELDRVLGGGIVKGSMILISGEPGIGKSTLLLQVCQSICHDNTVLYVTGEESPAQIKMRAGRLGIDSEGLYIMSETDLENVLFQADRLSPPFIFIDSIQTMYDPSNPSAPGSITQVRECTMKLMQYAKEAGISVLLVGHINKDGNIAGPKLLEHMVDTVLYFEGDRHASYRILRAVKNRFGSTNEIGVFEMRQDGLAEVENPSEYMLSGKPENASGSVVACSMEGTRPILIEIQALVCRSNFGMPRRTAAGTDYNRVNLLMAVLEKRLGLSLGNCDAYVNIAGGIRMNEPAIDLGIVMAIMSSYRNRPIDEKTIVFGEVGLSGEVRAVSMPEQRVNEAKKLGFETCILPEVSLKMVKGISGIRLVGVKTINDVAGFI